MAILGGLSLKPVDLLPIIELRGSFNEKSRQSHKRKFPKNVCTLLQGTV